MPGTDGELSTMSASPTLEMQEQGQKETPRTTWPEKLRRGFGSAGSLTALATKKEKVISSNGDSGTLGMLQVSLVWSNLTVSVKNTNKILLNNVQGRIGTGLYAIMGPSGSGKSTLLNTLARRLDRNMKIVSGDIKLNGRDYSHSDLKWMSGYVMQDDMLNGELTVVETLNYTAKLRLPPTVSSEERGTRVNQVMTDMGISHVQDVVIGTPLKKGISGGERKRVCVAMELLTQPVLLFLDEPTSGLDSVTALSLCTKLKGLADSSTCTVVCTIHQPQAKIFRLFDNLLLLKSGEIIYGGIASEAASYFAQAGFPVPSHENPANHFMDVITPSINESMDDLAAKEAKLKETFRQDPVDLTEGEDRPQFLQREVTPWIKQFWVLFLRSMQQQWRRWDVLLAQIAQTIIMAVLVGTAYLKIGKEPSKFSQIKPSLFFCAVNQGVFGAMTVINIFPSERLLVLRERAAGTYYVSAYFAAKCAAEAFWQLPPPIVFSCIVYWIIWYQALASKFFIFMAFMILTTLSSTSLALAVSAVARTTDMSVTILPLVLEISRLFGGLYLAPNNTPGYFVWLNAISYLYYSYIGISLNEYQGTPNGEALIVSLGLNTLTIGKCVGILISYIVICRIIAYLGIRYIKW